MNILAIDPGTTQSAFVVLNERFDILDKGILENEAMLIAIKTTHTAVDKLVIEMIASYGMSVGASVFETCVWIGRFIEAWDGDYKQIYRREIKMQLCGTMKAKDSNIRQYLIDRFGVPGTKKNKGKLYGISKDIWSALAVGVCYFDKEVNK